MQRGSCVRIPGRKPGACVLPLLSLYFPVTCNSSEAVTLPNIQVHQYIEVPQRVTHPYVGFMEPRGVRERERGRERERVRERECVYVCERERE